MNFENKSESLNGAMQAKKVERDRTKRSYLTNDKYHIWVTDEKGHKYKIEYLLGKREVK